MIIHHFGFVLLSSLLHLRNISFELREGDSKRPCFTIMCYDLLYFSFINKVLEKKRFQFCHKYLRFCRRQQGWFSSSRSLPGALDAPRALGSAPGTESGEGRIHA